MKFTPARKESFVYNLRRGRETTRYEVVRRPSAGGKWEAIAEDVSRGEAEEIIVRLKKRDREEAEEQATKQITE